jgi:hypothetical protein
MYGLCCWPARWNWKEIICYLLSQQEIHRLWDSVFYAWKDLLCIGLGC